MPPEVTSQSNTTRTISEPPNAVLPVPTRGFGIVPPVDVGGNSEKRNTSTPRSEFPTTTSADPRSNEMNAKESLSINLETSKQVDLEKYSYERLTQRYSRSDNLYHISDNTERERKYNDSIESSYCVYDRHPSFNLFEITKFKNGDTEIKEGKIDSRGEKYYITTVCDKNGKIFSYSDPKNNVSFSEEIAGEPLSINLEISKQVDLEKYSYERLTKQYSRSDKRYHIERGFFDDSVESLYRVYDRNSSLFLFEITKFKNGDTEIKEGKIDSRGEKYYITTVCDKNGKISSYNDPKNNVFFRDKITQIENPPHYTGDPYHITIENNIIQGENLQTGRKFKIDTDKLFEFADPKNKKSLRDTIHKFPVEALHDLSIEVDYITHKKDDKNTNTPTNVGGECDYDKETFWVNDSLQNALHELGHLIQHVRVPGSPSGHFYDNSVLLETFNKELATYKDNGGVIFDSEKNNIKVYCTKRYQEMFAECYTLLMLGDCQSKDTIIQHFPETLEQVKIRLQEIRQLPDEVRHTDQRPRLEAEEKETKRTVTEIEFGLYEEKVKERFKYLENAAIKDGKSYLVSSDDYFYTSSIKNIVYKDKNGNNKEIDLSALNVRDGNGKNYLDTGKLKKILTSIDAVEGSGLKEAIYERLDTLLSDTYIYKHDGWWCTTNNYSSQNTAYRTVGARETSVAGINQPKAQEQKEQDVEKTGK